MSAGHTFHEAPAGVSYETIDKYLRDPDLNRLVNRFTHFDHGFDLPYLAGYSKDGTTVYIDRHLPDVIIGEQDGKKYPFRPDRFLKLHETWEKALIDHYGFSYAAAHQAATKIEHRAVFEAGIPISVYDGRNSVISHYIKIDDHEKIKKVPKNLDLTPYKGDRRILPVLLTAMGRDVGKATKESVDYGPGQKAEHCGPVAKWKKGDCRNYLDPNGCKKVAGFISPTNWCKLWAKK